MPNSGSAGPVSGDYCDTIPPEQMINAIHKDLDAFRFNTPKLDDLTMLMLRRRG